MSDRTVVGIRLYVPFIDTIVRRFKGGKLWLEYSFDEHQRRWIAAAALIVALALAIIIVCDIQLAYMKAHPQF